MKADSFMRLFLYWFLLGSGFVTADSDELPANWEQLVASDVLSDKSSHTETEDDTLFEGDIMGIDRHLGAVDPIALEKMAQNAISDGRQLWSSGTVPYTIGSGFTSSDVDTIQAAMRNMMAQTCIKFVRRTNERDFITLVKRGGCSSYIGRQGSQQTVQLGFGCLNNGIVQHEIMHALGFHHEQSRKDRDRYVTVVWNNIPSHVRDNFVVYQDGDLLRQPYDYGSVMHYEWNAFGRNPRQPTIIPKVTASIGQRRGMSESDVKKINLVYRCNGGRTSNLKEERRPVSGGSQRIIYTILFGDQNNATLGKVDPQSELSTRLTTSTTTTTTTTAKTSGIKAFFKKIFG